VGLLVTDIDQGLLTEEEIIAADMKGVTLVEIFVITVAKKGTGLTTAKKM